MLWHGFLHASVWHWRLLYFGGCYWSSGGAWAFAFLSVWLVLRHYGGGFLTLRRHLLPVSNPLVRSQSAILDVGEGWQASPARQCNNTKTRMLADQVAYALTGLRLVLGQALFSNEYFGEHGLRKGSWDRKKMWKIYRGKQVIKKRMYSMEFVLVNKTILIKYRSSPHSLEIHFRLCYLPQICKHHFGVFQTIFSN